MTMFFELGHLYEKSAELAERALVVDPGTGYSLSDLAAGDQTTVEALFSSATTSMVAIQGTLHGCVTALRSFPNSANWLRSIIGHPPVPDGLHIGPAEFDDAIKWLTSAVADGLDDDSLDGEVAERAMSWHGTADMATRATGQILALVVIANAVCSMCRES